MKLDYSIFDRLSMSSIDSKGNILDNWYSEQFVRAGYILSNIETRKEKMYKKEEEIQDLQYERDLIQDDILEIIKHDLNDSAYNLMRNTLNTLYCAWEYSRYKNENRLKELGDDLIKDDRAFKYVMSLVRYNLLPDKYEKQCKLVEINDWMFSTSYEFVFEIGKIKFMIRIPNFSGANEKNYLEILQGYILTWQEDEITIATVYKNIDPRKVKEYLEKWLEEKGCVADTKLKNSRKGNSKTTKKAK